jgi:uncharacterized protein (DUF488 family)
VVCVIVTFGHTTLESGAALAALDAGGVDVVIDVRSHPTSRFTQWRREGPGGLAKWVPGMSGGAVHYQWWPELGGWDVRHCRDDELVNRMRLVGVDLAAYSGGFFPKQRIAAKAPAGDGPTWTNQGLLDYAWFTSTPEFNRGIDRLIDMFGREGQPTCALMCAEAVWWRCHRSMIADVLTARGVEVRHLPRWNQTHLDVLGDRLARYPERVRASWTSTAPRAAQPGPEAR